MTTAEVPSVGDLLAERYRLEEHVGGANGYRQLWRGVDVLLHRSVAVVLRSPGGDDAAPTMTAAVAASRAHVDSMVDVYDAVDEGRFAYVVREWVNGSSLRSVLERRTLESAHALELVASVADAVAALHEGGVTHADLHPGTILLSEDDRVMVTEPRNEPGNTPVEDVRALGATLYACLTGTWPRVVPAENTGLADAATDEWGAVLPAAQVAPGTPAALSKLTADLLDHSQTPPSAAELAVELRRLAESGGDEPAAAESRPTSVLGSINLGRRSADAPPAGMKRLAVIAAVAAGVILAGVITSAVVFGGGDDPAGAEDQVTGEDTGAEPSAEETSVAAPTEAELSPDALRVVDPPDGDRDQGENVEAVIDGNASTGWTTNTYYNDPGFGNLKPGMGILIDLGEAREVASVRVQMTSAGATVGLLAGDEDPGDSSEGDQAIVDNFTVLAEPVEDADTNIELQAGGEATRFIVVWVTELPPVSDGYKLTISDINVFVR
ncbi:protein kinase family protein [Glycomyces sp. TRM65418]|uniref:protein kinase family protein n=1 Tax=Glycomyces sp. TRM65418 TaxID=2867006 RepID=UPI001CE6449C|nr:protein kinase family protein [Glycomyces sp. TRM65418]MCC3764118.1 protein kinase family protein [Glycomyces sp. TRM65418]QZD53806.1 protein kinase family protein [Glycomyces sp. TRM65418]